MRKVILILIGLAMAAALPVLGHWARHSPGPVCALDGVKIDPLFQVRVVDDRGTSHRFCCIGCAEAWLTRDQAGAAAVYVTDEATGKEIDAASAYFVRSSVVTTPATGNRIHAFQHQVDAERHADACGGRVLSGAEKPLRLRPAAGVFARPPADELICCRAFSPRLEP